MNNSKCILVLGAGPYQVSGIQKLVDKGYYTIALDGNQAAIGKNIASEFHCVNILSFEEVDSFVQSFGSERILSCMSFCTDAPMKVLGRLNSLYSWKGLKEDVTLISTDKSRQRKIMKECGLPTPHFQILSSPGQTCSIDIPCVVKPVDSAGSRGVSVVFNKNELKGAIDSAFSFSKSGSCVVEEYIVGTEYTVEALIKNRDVFILGISEKTKPIGNFTVSNQLHYNSPRVLKYKEQIIQVVSSFVKAAGFDNSISHTELIFNQKDGDFYLIESSLRSGGFAIFDEVLPYLADDDIVGKTIDTCLDKRVQIPNCGNRAVIMNFLSANPGKLDSISVNTDNFGSYKEATYKYGFLKKAGEKIEKLHSDGARVAYILTFSDNWYNAFYLSNLIAYSFNIKVDCINED